MELANELSLTPLKNNKKTSLLGRLEWDYVGVEEWMRNIAESSFIVTRSFHGLVFAILYHRQFAIVASPNGRNNRIIDLLSLLGLSARFYDSFVYDNSTWWSEESLYMDKPWNARIDYDEVDRILNRKRQESMKDLKSAFKS